MKKLLLSVAGAAALLATPAAAADMGARIVTKAPVIAPAPSPWDIAFGGGIMSDYNFRGISQSAHGVAGTAYIEPRINVNDWLQLYAGIAGTSVKLPTDPSAEVDFYAGVRPTFGPIAFDLGFIYYWYPKETQFCGNALCPGSNSNPPFPNGNTTLKNTDFWEIYGKAAYTFNDFVTVGANVYYSPSWLNTGADGTYLSGTAKFTAPGTLFPSGIGAYLSGEFGYYWLGTSDYVQGVYYNNANNGGVKFPDYAYWNVGVGLTYKAFTLDLRYHDTDLSKAKCNVLTADPKARITNGVPVNNTTTFAASNWCGEAFIAKLSFDTTLAALK